MLLMNSRMNWGAWMASWAELPSYYLVWKRMRMIWVNTVMQLAFIRCSSITDFTN